MDNYIVSFLAIFASTFVADVAWVFYIKYVEQGKAFLAGVFGSVLYLITGYVVIAYVSNIYMLIPAVLGAFFGSYFTVKFSKKIKSEI